ncbi:MAG: TonB-dependent receptor [Bacteroidetes bacterium]|nr:TonB-dependent receptor [Bacteroidota bacterium]
MKDAKVALWLSMFCLILHSIPHFAQSPDLSCKVSLTTNKKPLSQFLDDLSQQCALNITYSHKHISDTMLVTAQYSNVPVKTILEEILPAFQFRYKLIEKQIVITPNQVDWPMHVFGYVTNANNREMLIGATIFSEDYTNVAISNEYGYYSIELSKPITGLKVSYLGFKKKTISVDLTDNQRIDIALEQDTSHLNPVVININDWQMVRKSPLGYHQLKTKTVQNISSSMGEADMLKSLSYLPGINFYADGSVNFHVRGGDHDQNMILVDEAQVFNPSHLFGLYSSFVPEAVNNLNIYKTDIPAKYGGRLSSLIDIKIKEGNKEHFSAGAQMGLTSGLLRIEGPFLKNKSSYFLTLRRSHIKPLLQNAYPELNELGFYDIYAKTSFRINENNKVLLSFYRGGDNMTFTDEETSLGGFSWANSLLNLRWNHNHGHSLFANSTLVLSGYNYFLHNSFRQNDYWNSSITNITLKTDVNYYLNASTSVHFGYQLGLNTFDPGTYHSDSANSKVNIPVVPRHFTSEIAGYGSVEKKLTPEFSFQAGLRASLWNNHGEAILFSYNDHSQPIDTTFIPSDTIYNQYFHFEPRLRLTYKFNDKQSLKASYTKTVQYLQLLPTTNSGFTALDQWLPANHYIRPQIAHNFTIGYLQEIIKPGVFVTTEVFGRLLRNQIEIIYNANTILNPHIEQELSFGRARAYGFEFQINKEIGNLTGWINYTYTRVLKEFATLNNGRQYPANYDKPHDMAVLLNYPVGNRVTLHANWAISSGAAFSEPGSFMYYRSKQVPIYSEKNNRRFPTYHRLDVAALFRLNKPGNAFDHQIKLAIYNVYARKNTISINFNKTIDDNGDIFIPNNELEMRELITTQTFVSAFFPSLTYVVNFR